MHQHVAVLACCCPCCRLLHGEGEDRGPLTPDELKRLRAQLDAWLEDESPSALLELGGSMLLIRAALDMLKQGCRGRGGLQLQDAQLQKAQGQAAGMEGAQIEQLRKLKLQAGGSGSLGALPPLA